MKIDLTKYKLVQPSRINKRKKEKVMYDIQVKDDHTFHVFLDENTKLLCHNCDGQHIASLIINFFYQWFPYIIKEGRLKKFVTPLVVCNWKNNKKYFYSLKEFQNFSENEKLSEVNYLKGLGSLSMEDWQWVMSNKILFNIIEDRSAKKFLDIAFGDNTEKRKKWLSK
jgi:DNA gyrase/topoisomerase IV subunit B